MRWSNGREFSPSTTDAVDDVLTGGGNSAVVLPTFAPPALPVGTTAQLPVAGQPEVREYRMRFRDKGTANGDWTDVVKQTVSP